MNMQTEVLSNNPTILDKMEAGLLSREALEEEVFNQVYAGLRQYCQIPPAYTHCSLETQTINLAGLDDKALRNLLAKPPPGIVNPGISQIKAIELFKLLLAGDPLVCDGNDPLNPTIGAYLYGPPGSGKTHLMAAYGKCIAEKLERELSDVRKVMLDIIEAAYIKYIERQSSESGTSDTDTGYVKLNSNLTITKELSPTEEFWDTVHQFQSHLQSYDYQPTDLIYIGFKELVEICQNQDERQKAMLALENARLVFIDDIHPQGNNEQIQIVLHLLERRYELGKAGTFLTTNLTTEELGGGDEKLGNRLLSRCAEMLVTVDFSDCDDWRLKVKARRVTLVEKELDARIHRHPHKPSSTL
jgi:hypothetical protein